MRGPTLLNLSATALACAPVRVLRFGGHYNSCFPELSHSKFNISCCSNLHKTQRRFFCRPFAKPRTRRVRHDRLFSRTFRSQSSHSFEASTSLPPSSFSSSPSSSVSTSSPTSSCRQVYTWPTTPNPSPYAILHVCRSDGKYTKSRSAFSHWMMLYHPDMSNCTHKSCNSTRSSYIDDSHSSLSRAEKARRFALVLAADKLLSDPSRRQLYDLYGMGWDNYSATNNCHANARASNGMRGTPFRHREPHSAGAQNDYRDRYYGGIPNSDEFSTEEDGPISRSQARVVAVFTACLTLTALGLGVHSAFLREEKMQQVHRRASQHLIQVQNAAQQRWERALEMELAANGPRLGNQTDCDSNRQEESNLEGKTEEVDKQRVLQRMMDEWREQIQNEQRRTNR